MKNPRSREKKTAVAALTESHFLDSASAPSPKSFSKVHRRRCQIADVQNSRGFGMQQTERWWTDLARSTNKIHKTKINTRKIEMWQSSTHRKWQTAEVHLYKTDKMPNTRRAK